jgi:hypothetical protein
VLFEVDTMRIDWSALTIPLLRAMVILVPSYTAAYLTGEMVYTVPTLAASASLAAAIKQSAPADTQQRVDEDGGGDDNDNEDAEDASPDGGDGA